MKVERITPLLIVPALEPLLPLWRDAMGYQILAQVQEDPGAPENTGPLGFVLLLRDGHQVMLQTRASLEKDLPAIAKEGVTSCLYIDVDSLDEHMKAMSTKEAGATLIVPERTTFYGAREAAYRTGSGHVVIVSEHKES